MHAASPNPSGPVIEMILDGVSAVSATSTSNVWAVGDFSNAGPSQVFAIHCY